MSTVSAIVTPDKVVSDQPSDIFSDTLQTRILYGRDLRLNDVTIITPTNVYGITGQELRDIDLNAQVGGDLKTAAGRQDVAQSLITRVRTRRGELAWAGDTIHANYGSDVWRMLGQPNTPINRSLAAGYVADALRQDPRVASVGPVTVQFFLTLRSFIFISAQVTLIGSQTPLSLVFNID